MDLSGIIFVALAVAWAAYLVPKALKHHDEVARTRSVDRFSHTMRVLARREPVNHRDARLVVSPQRSQTGPVVTSKPSARAPVTDQDRARLRARREAARLAAKRRRRVLSVLLLGVVTLGVLAGLAIVGWPWIGVPAGLVLAWLVLCRVMVRRERRTPRGLDRPVAPGSSTDELSGLPADYAVRRNEQGFDEVAPDAATSTDLPADPERAGMWDPIPTTLPTYVTKEPAARTVQTIDLESTGVWTSGRTETDSALAREADAERERTPSDSERQRAVGS